MCVCKENIVFFLISLSLFIQFSSIVKELSLVCVTTSTGSRINCISFTIFTVFFCFSSIHFTFGAVVVSGGMAGVSVCQQRVGEGSQLGLVGHSTAADEEAEAVATHSINLLPSN